MNDFLAPFQQGEGVEIPVGSERSGPSVNSLIMKATASLQWTNGSFTTLDLRGHEEYSPDDFVQSKSGTFKYYWAANRRVVAEAAMERINEELTEIKQPARPYNFPARLVWRIKTVRDSLLTVAPDKRESFAEMPSWEVDVRNMKSRMYRHSYQFIALPQTVQAVAQAAGQLDRDIINFGAPATFEQDGEEKTLSLAVAMIQARTGVERGETADGEETEWAIEDHEIFTPEFLLALVGGAADQNSNVPEGAWVDSVLGQQRIELWNALGETNTEAFTRTPGSNYSINPESVLFQVLGFIENPWPNPLWIRLGTLLDPLPKAGQTNDEGQVYRPRIPAILRIFQNEAEAQQAADEELAARNSNGAGEVGGSAPVESYTSQAHPPLSGMWTSLDGAADVIVQNLAKYANEDDAAVIARMGFQDIPGGATAAEQLRAWREYAS